MVLVQHQVGPEVTPGWERIPIRITNMSTKFLDSVRQQLFSWSPGASADFQVTKLSYADRNAEISQGPTTDV